MLESGFILSNTADFDNAMFFGIIITVRQKGEIIDYGGKITKHTDEAVYINDGYYLKATCDFKVR